MSFNNIKPDEVKSVVSEVMAPFGQPFVLDLKRSEGCYVYDSLHDRQILDMFSYFATNALGHNHPKEVNDKDYQEELLLAARSNPSNSDFYTTQYANFISAFRKIAMPKEFKHAFFISGGTLAVENALKVAMDWKIKLLKKKGKAAPENQQVIHFKEAFHGRSGYTLSLTNTEPVDIRHFTQFKWPRIENPKIRFPLNDKHLEEVVKKEEEAVRQIRKVLEKDGDSICSIIIEPIQSEGGDNHFRNEFFVQLRQICDEQDVMLIFDEVQNGMGLTGKLWAYQHFDIVPDIVAFGKKMQTCGIMSTSRVDEIEDNCFTVEKRINSTWGGSLADMVHATKILRVMEEDGLVENAANQGAYILEQLHGLSKDYPIDNVRGRGLQCAFDLESKEKRDQLIKDALKHDLLLLGAGERSIRFRPPLIVSSADVDRCTSILRRLL